MAAPPDLVFSEPVATGALRVELYGDAGSAGQHLGAARALLGGMRGQYGVDARTAAGEPGGFYTQQLVLADGTRIEAITNGGLDTVRIHAPGPAAPAPPPAAAPTVSTAPYLWIGVRQTAPDPDLRLHVCVWEPPVFPGEAMQVLSNRNEFAGTDGSDPQTYPLGPWTQFTPAGDTQNGVAYTDQHLVMLLPHNGLPMREPDSPADAPAFDVVFISDPDNELGLTDADGDPMTGSGLGQHFVKLMVHGDDCPGPRHPPSADLELRIVVGGRGDYRQHSVRRITITEYTIYLNGILPFGWDGEDNPHFTHWWQGMATAQLLPRQLNVPPAQAAPSSAWFSPDGQAALPPTGFVPGPWPDRCEPPPPNPPPLRRHVHTEDGNCLYDLSSEGHTVGTPPNDGIYFRLTLRRNAWHSTTDYDMVQFWDAIEGYLPEQIDLATFASTYDETGYQVIFNEDVYAPAAPWHEVDQLLARERDFFNSDVCPTRTGE